MRPNALLESSRVGTGKMNQKSDLSPGGFEMLRAAVNAARQFQYRSVAALKAKLLSEWPDRVTDINEAIDYWAGNLRARYPNGLPAE